MHVLKDIQHYSLVEGPAANHLKLTIDSLSASYNSYQCYHWLEIRYNLAGQTGPK